MRMASTSTRGFRTSQKAKKTMTFNPIQRLNRLVIFESIAPLSYIAVPLHDPNDNIGINLRFGDGSQIDPNSVTIIGIDNAIGPTPAPFPPPPPPLQIVIFPNLDQPHAVIYNTSASPSGVFAAVFWRGNTSTFNEAQGIAEPLQYPPGGTPY